ENEVHIKTGIKRAGGVGELAFVHFLHLLDFGALFFEFGFQTLDNVMHALFLPLRVKDEQRFVTILHDSSSILLKVFIAETTPLSIAHFTASAARLIVDLTSSFSSSKKLLSTKSLVPSAGAGPIPTRSRGISSVPNWTTIDSNPLWPPGLPLCRIRNRPSGNEKSSR